jgi:hypothetical protein
MWTRLAQLPLAWRLLIKWAALGVVTAFALFPHPVLLARHVQHVRNIEALIQPDLPEIAAINREIDAKLNPDATRKDQFRTVERWVYEHIRYEYDWFNWGNLDYWPTAAEVLERKREDCDGQAVLAASILRGRGFKTAHIVANLQHVWVAVDGDELMGPQKDKNYRRVGGKTVLTLPQWRTVLASSAMICKFPALRSLLILAAALVLAYHPCRHLTGLFAVFTVALVGFILLLDWGNRFDARAQTLVLGPLVSSLILLAGALVGALLAERLLIRKSPVTKPLAAEGKA